MGNGCFPATCEVRFIKYFSGFPRLTWKRGRSEGLKSLGEQPHQSTMCLYWHLHPSLRFQLVSLRLLSTMVSQWALFSSTVWKNDWTWRRKDREMVHSNLFKIKFANFTLFCLTKDFNHSSFPTSDFICVSLPQNQHRPPQINTF